MQKRDNCYLCTYMRKLGVAKAAAIVTACAYSVRGCFMFVFNDVRVDYDYVYVYEHISS